MKIFKEWLNEAQGNASKKKEVEKFLDFIYKNAFKAKELSDEDGTKYKLVKRVRVITDEKIYDVKIAKKAVGLKGEGFCPFEGRIHYTTEGDILTSFEYYNYDKLFDEDNLINVVAKAIESCFGSDYKISDKRIDKRGRKIYINATAKSSLKEWLTEATKKEYTFQGWKKTTKAQFIRDLSENKSLFLFSAFWSDKDENYPFEVVKNGFTQTMLKNSIDQMKRDNKWRTAKTSSQHKITFAPSGILGFDQVGDKYFYSQEIGNGIVYLFFTYYYEEKWDEHQQNYMLYYVEKKQAKPLTKTEATKLSKALKNIFKKDKLDLPPHGEYQLKSKVSELNAKDFYIEFFLQGKELKNARTNLVLLRIQQNDADKLDILINLYPYKEMFEEIDALKTFEKMFPLAYKDYAITKQIHTGYDTVLRYQAEMK